MLNLSMALATAIKSMQANSYALNTTTHNVANMNNADYSKQLASITASSPVSISGQAGQIGTGSQVSSIERVRDIYLDRQIRTEWMNYGKDEILDRTYQNLKIAFPELDGLSETSSNNLGSQIGKFFSAWSDVSTQAANAAKGLDNTLNSSLDKVYQLALSISQLLNEKSDALTNMQIDLNSDLKTSVQAANVEIKTIYELNKSIVFITGQGQRPNDLLDKRDAAMARLAELVNFDTANRTDGSVVILLAGRSLVNGGDGYSVLTTMTSGTLISTSTSPGPPLIVNAIINVKDSKLESVGISGSNGANPVKVDDNVFTGGKISGILESRDQIIHDYRSQLDEIANTLVTVVNKIYSSTNTINTAAGITTYTSDNRNFFTGTLASNIGVDKSIKGASDINYTMYTAGDIAKILGNLGDKLISTNVHSTKLTAINNNSSPKLSEKYLTLTSGSLIINGISIAVNSTDTMSDLVNHINSASTQFSAVYNDSTKELYLVSNEPLVITESGLGGQFLSTFELIEEQISASTIAYQGAMATTQLESTYYAPKFLNLANQNYLFDYELSDSGTVSVQSNNTENSVSWVAAAGIAGEYTNVVNNVVGGGLSGYNIKYDAVTNQQKVSFFNKSVAGTISPFVLSDKKGNLLQTLKIVGNIHFNELYTSIISEGQGGINSSSNMLSADKSALDQLQAMQDNITHVDQNAELAQAKLYQRAYDASVQLMMVVDEMMNMLINHTATSSSTSTT